MLIRCSSWDSICVRECPDSLQAAHASITFDPVRKIPTSRKIGQNMEPSHSLEDLYGRPGFLLKRCHQVAAAIFLDECNAFNVKTYLHGCLCVMLQYTGVSEI